MNNNQNAKRGAPASKKNKASKAGKAAIENKRMTEYQKMETKMRKLEAKTKSLTKNNSVVTVVNGAVNVSMPKPKVDKLLDQFLLPENSDCVIPFGVTGKDVCQFVGPALRIELENGLGTNKTTFESMVVVSPNPEAPLLTATKAGIESSLVMGEWGEIESRTGETNDKPTAIGGNIWISDNDTLRGMVLQEPLYNEEAVDFDDDTVTHLYRFGLLSFTTTDANTNMKIQSTNGASGTVYFCAADGSVQLSHNFDPEGTDVYWGPSWTNRFMIIVQRGTADVALKFINVTSSSVKLKWTGPTVLKPVVSPAYTAINDGDRNPARVVSSAVCLTYAPDMQYGGGSLVAAIADASPIGQIDSWESYLYSRPKSHMAQALKGAYCVCLPNPRSLEFKDIKRHNHFYSDANSLGIIKVQYKPANAGVNVDSLNMQVKGQVWYEFTTSDRSRGGKRYMDQNEVCSRIFSGLSMVYRPSENPNHHEFTKLFKNAWSWLNGGSDEATALRKAAATVGKGALTALPGLLAAL